MDNCIECGCDVVEDQICYIYPKRGHCFICYFWINLIKRTDIKTVVIDNCHYIIGQETDNILAKFKGYAARKFTIQFHNGEVIETDNLWCQGDIPERFQDRLPNNAVFLRDGQPEIPSVIFGSMLYSKLQQDVIKKNE